MAFNLWNPIVGEPRRIDFDVTARDAAMVGAGTLDFVASCLMSLDLPGVGINRWAVRAVRQSYYSDYPESADWRARWDVAWRFEVWLAGDVAFQNRLRPFPTLVAAIDESAPEDEPTGAMPALVIAWFRPQAAADASERVVVDWSTDRGLRGSERPNSVRFDGGFRQTRIMFDDAKFPDDIEALAALNDRLGQAGGLTTWRALAAATST